MPHLTPLAKDMAPKQPSVQALLGSRGKDILEVAEDIYHGLYQLAPSNFSHQYLDLLMQELHDDLDQRLVRAGLHSTQAHGGPTPGAEHAPVPLNGPAPYHKLSHHHQRQTGGKAPQPHSSVDSALCKAAEYFPQALHRAGSASIHLQEVKGKHPPAQHQDMGRATG